MKKGYCLTIILLGAGKMAIILGTVLCLVLLACEKVVKRIEISPNQIWVKEYETDNPFSQVRRDTMIIVDVKKGYVKYIRFGKVQSDQIYWVVTNARRVK